MRGGEDGDGDFGMNNIRGRCSDDDHDDDYHNVYYYYYTTHPTRPQASEAPAETKLRPPPRAAHAHYTHGRVVGTHLLHDVTIRRFSGSRGSRHELYDASTHNISSSPPSSLVKNIMARKSGGRCRGRGRGRGRSLAMFDRVVRPPGRQLCVCSVEISENVERVNDRCCGCVGAWPWCVAEYVLAITLLCTYLEYLPYVLCTFTLRVYHIST